MLSDANLRWGLGPTDDIQRENPARNYMCRAPGRIVGPSNRAVPPPPLPATRILKSIVIALIWGVSGAPAGHIDLPAVWPCRTSRPNPGPSTPNRRQTQTRCHPQFLAQTTGSGHRRVHPGHRYTWVSGIPRTSVFPRTLVYAVLGVPRTRRGKLETSPRTIMCSR